MKELFEQVIALKNYDLKALLANIDQYHIEGKLTDDERQELAQAAREGATADYDYAGEINALWAAVRALQQSIAPPAEDEWPEFVQPTGAGTVSPSNSRGREYCGYSSRPEEKLSVCALSSQPSTPGTSRATQSTSTIAPSSPPVRI